MAACENCPCGDRVPDGYLLVREDEWERQQRARARLSAERLRLRESLQRWVLDAHAILTAPSWRPGSATPSHQGESDE